MEPIGLLDGVCCYEDDFFRQTASISRCYKLNAINLEMFFDQDVRSGNPDNAAPQNR